MEDQRDISKDFGCRLKRLRLERGLTQEQLADMAGRDRTYIGDAELGKRNPTLLSIQKLAMALGVDFLALLSDDELERELGSGDIDSGCHRSGQL